MGWNKFSSRNWFKIIIYSYWICLLLADDTMKVTQHDDLNTAIIHL